MVQTFQGYFLDDGRFIPDGVSVKVPTRRRTIVNVLDESIEENTEISQTDIIIQERVSRIDLILAAALDAKDEMTEDEWDEMLNLRARTNAGLSRAVEI